MNKMADLKKRFGVSVVTIGLISSLIIFSHQFWISILLLLIMCVLVAVGIWEYVSLAKAKGHRPSLRFMIGISLALVLAFFLTVKASVSQLVPICILCVGFILLFLRRFSAAAGSLTNIAIEFFGICYLSIPLSMMLGILYPSPYMGYDQEGRFWLFYLILVTKIADVAAYFIGRLFGKHPLAKTLSPKKTIEGSIAGFLASILMSVGLQVLGQKLFNGSFALSFGFSIVLGALIGIFSQLGDLAESLLKRDAHVKDSNALPGLGGVLDMVDSLLFTAPIIYVFLNFLS